MFLGQEEYTMGDIAPSGNGTQRGRTIETAIDATTTMTTQRPWLSADVRFAIGIDQYLGLAHSSVR
jgi:hypothetical protein